MKDMDKKKGRLPPKPMSSSHTPTHTLYIFRGKAVTVKSQRDKHTDTP